MSPKLQLVGCTMVLGLAVATSLTPPMASTKAPDSWKAVGTWNLVEPPDQTEKITKIVRERVGKMIEAKPDGGFARKYELGDHPIAFPALQSMSLMAALPYLAKRTDTDSADQKLFNSARTAISKGMHDALKATMPEYWNSVQPNGAVAYDPAKTKKDTVRDVAGRLVAGGRAYEAGVLLMAFEHYFNGANDYPFEAANLPRDRPARQAVLLSPAAQLGVARLTAYLLLKESTGKDYKEEFESTLAPGSLWMYDKLGTSPKETCMSKSSTAMMGLRAALSLNLVFFEDDAFKFELDKDKGPLGKAAFMRRLSDVLVHAVLTIVDVPPKSEAKSADDSIGFLGYDRICEIDTARSAAFKSEPGADITCYRTRYSRSGSGRRIFQIEYNSTASLLGGHKQEAAYRYLPYQDYAYGCYHTAGAGYCLGTALNALPLVWNAAAKLDPGADGSIFKPQYAADGSIFKPQYPVELMAANKWKVAKQHEVSIDETQPFTPVTFGDRPCRQRIAQCANFIVRQMTTGNDPAALRHLPQDNKFARTDKVLSLAPIPVHQPYFRGIGLYGILKFGLSIGAPDALGNWLYFPDLVEVLSASDYTGLSATGSNWGHNEFLILTLTKSYRPLFGRDSGAN